MTSSNIQLLVDKYNKKYNEKIKYENKIYNFYKSYKVTTEINSNYVSEFNTFVSTFIDYRYNYNFELYLESSGIRNGAYIKYPLKNIRSILMNPINFFVGITAVTLPSTTDYNRKIYLLIENLKQQSYTGNNFNFHFSYDQRGSYNYENNNQIYTFNTPIQYLNNLFINFYYNFELLMVRKDVDGIYPSFTIDFIFDCIY